VLCLFQFPTGIRVISTVKAIIKDSCVCWGDSCFNSLRELELFLPKDALYEVIPDSVGFNSLRELELFLHLINFPLLAWSTRTKSFNSLRELELFLPSTSFLYSSANLMFQFPTGIRVISTTSRHSRSSKINKVSIPYGN